MGVFRAPFTVGSVFVPAFLVAILGIPLFRRSLLTVRPAFRLRNLFCFPVLVSTFPHIKIDVAKSSSVTIHNCRSLNLKLLLHLPGSSVLLQKRFQDIVYDEHRYYEFG